VHANWDVVELEKKRRRDIEEEISKKRYRRRDIEEP
jgi:hypothetical protein